MNSYLNQLFNLKDCVVAITGAGGHLCSEMARGFAKVGCKVAVLDLRLEKAKSVESELKTAGFKDVIGLQIDVAKKQDHEEAIKTIISNFGKIDILINGAGTNGSTNFLELSLDE